MAKNDAKNTIAAHILAMPIPPEFTDERKSFSLKSSRRPTVSFLGRGERRPYKNIVVIFKCVKANFCYRRYACMDAVIAFEDGNQNIAKTKLRGSFYRNRRNENKSVWTVE